MCQRKVWIVISHAEHIPLVAAALPVWRRRSTESFVDNMINALFRVRRRPFLNTYFNYTIPFWEVVARWPVTMTTLTDNLKRIRKLN